MLLVIGSGNPPHPLMDAAQALSRSFNSEPV